MERVTDIVAEQLGVDKEKITPETSFVNDLGADSLDTVELVMELEEEFDINIPDDAAEKIQTVGQAVEYIEARFDHPLTIDDVARHSRVSARMLQMSFKKFKGVTPMSFLKTVRLERARAALQSGAQSRGTVTRVALEHGFAHLGQFAIEYKQRLGESPSETLQRS